jgi:hypothetical protein
MRSPYFITLLVTLVIGSIYWYQNPSNQCPVPLEYRIGALDSEFDISLDQAKAYVSAAELYWEDISGRQLFVYDEQADFTVDFLFDERQATANSEESSRTDLDVQFTESEEVKKSLTTLQNEYDSLVQSYSAKVTDYESRLQSYNDTVNTYNDRGGAPPDTFAGLETERKILADELDTLNQTEGQLSALATNINRLGEKGNRLVNDYNQDVSRYNNSYGHSREFTQGDYRGESISIYKFTSENELLTVLGHELGHALGILHVEGTSSLMYYLLEDTTNTPSLSETDLAAYFDVCGTKETLSQSTRGTIRGFLKSINI